MSGKEEAKVDENGEEVEETYCIEPICKVPPAKRPRPAPPGARVQETADILGPDSQHAYVQKWVKMEEEEKNENVKFDVVRNDGPNCSREQLVRLLGLKNVFVKQLPNMPKPYVTRLVFDRKHESLALLKRGTDGDYIVMGGCCYRPFPKQGFGEIAFLAISHSEQVRGYGTRLMAQTKERAKSLGLTVLLTCADNNAVPYFKKQGFSKKITLPLNMWQGYIKDYEGVTLMECKLHKKVNYLRIPAMLKAQKMCLVEKLKEVSNSHIVYPGIDARKRKGIDVMSIPGLSDIYPSKDPPSDLKTKVKPPSIANKDPEAQAELKQHLQNVLNQVKSHNAAWPFIEPVDPQKTGAVDYYEVIKNPIDLKTIQDRLDIGWYYITKDIFIADVRRMVENCYHYNGKHHYVSELGGQLEKFFMHKI